MTQPPRKRARRRPPAAGPVAHAPPDGGADGAPPPPFDATAAAAAARTAAKHERRGRALQRQAFLAQRAGMFDLRALDTAMAVRLAAMRPADGPGGHGRLTRAIATSDVQRWVPIGPSIVRRGQAEGRPRVTGRITDLQVSPDGTRAYAASAKGGVWYTSDGGATWAPVGSGADRAAVGGGNNNARACGCLLVSFGATAFDDYVMVGTGELVPWGLVSAANTGQQGGIGILAAAAPTTAAPGAPTWEAEAGIAQFEGLGVFRMARRPGSTPGKATAADADRVVAATSAGLFLGTRAAVAGPPPSVQWTWAKLATLDAFAGGAAPQVTDVLWLAGGAQGRLIVALASLGVAFSDTLGAAGSWTWVTNLNQPTAAMPIAGRLSLSEPVGGRVYVLGELSPAPPAGVPSLWLIPSITAASPTATAVAGVPAALWGTQRDYDQAIAVDVVGGTDRVFLGGSTVMAAPGGDWSASLWAFDVTAAPALVAAPGVSRTGAPLPAGAGGDGADQPGLVGNNVHADIHAIRVVKPAGATPQLWVGCDGGVFVSAQGGRCNSFQTRAVGLAVLEVGFHAAHPSSSHFVASGCQDNGTQVRTGDTVWEELLEGDGGGVVFHPVQPQYVVAQYTNGTWYGRPASGFQDPVYRFAGGGSPAVAGRESNAAAFYSGAAAVATSPARARIAIGTNRVWLTDDLGVAATNTWRVIPAPNGALADPNPGGTDPVAQQGFGVPPGALGSVIQLRWASPTDLLAIYDRGLVRYVENPATHVWTATVLIPGTPGAPNPATNLLTDVCPVPGSGDCYITTAGDVPVAPAAPADTCWFYHAATNTVNPTGLRSALDVAGPPLVRGPLDPAYAVAVDPGVAGDVYVGTVTGVWRGQRATPTVHVWTPFVNGLPQATVQDLAVWVDAGGAAGAPRLLRAGVQSSGVWETNLAATEPQRTYLRVHARDDRRRFPTPMANPRRSSTASPEHPYASPDVVVRPANNRVTPTWQLPGAATIGAANAPRYQLWTFQTAFRWFYPAIAADGEWSDQMGDLVELHRTSLGLPAGRVIDRPLWNAVVGATRLTATGAVSAAPGDPLAVYHAPWESPAALGAPATEVDLMELVVPSRVINDVWQVFREPSTVDVLVHHRDTRALANNAAFATLLWQSGPSAAALLGLAAAAMPAFVASVLAGAPGATPAGWQLATPMAGAGVFRLGVPLEARLPRAIAIDVDFSTVPVGHHVLLLAVAGSTVDPLTTPPVGAPVTVVDLVRAWPYAALRLVRVLSRPA